MLNYEDEARVDDLFVAADEWAAYYQDMEEMARIQEEALLKFYSSK